MSLQGFPKGMYMNFNNQLRIEIQTFNPALRGRQINNRQSSIEDQ